MEKKVEKYNVELFVSAKQRNRTRMLKLKDTKRCSSFSTYYTYKKNILIIQVYAHKDI